MVRLTEIAKIGTHHTQIKVDVPEPGTRKLSSLDRLLDFKGEDEDEYYTLASEVV